MSIVIKKIKNKMIIIINIIANYYVLLFRNDQICLYSY